MEESSANEFGARRRPDTILVAITRVGERVEVDVFEDGHMEVSRFNGNESIAGGKDLVYELIRVAIERDHRVQAFPKLDR